MTSSPLGLGVQWQSLFRGPSGEEREIVAGEESPLAIEHRDLQLIAVVPDAVDFAREYTQVLGVLILEPESQYFDLGGRGTVHIDDWNYIQPAIRIASVFLLRSCRNSALQEIRRDWIKRLMEAAC